MIRPAAAAANHSHLMSDPLTRCHCAQSPSQAIPVQRPRKGAAPGVRVIMVRADPRRARSILLFFLPCGGSLWGVLSKKPIKTRRENFSRSAKAARPKRATTCTATQRQEEEEVQSEGAINKGHCVLPLASMRNRPVHYKRPHATQHGPSSMNQGRSRKKKKLKNPTG
jgi:hypothetical protein